MHIRTFLHRRSTTLKRDRIDSKINLVKYPLVCFYPELKTKKSASAFHPLFYCISDNKTHPLVFQQSKTYTVSFWAVLWAFAELLKHFYLLRFLSLANKPRKINKIFQSLSPSLRNGDKISSQALYLLPFPLNTTGKSLLRLALPYRTIYKTYHLLLGFLLLYTRIPRKSSILREFIVK